MALEVAQIAAWEWHLASGQMRWSTDPEVLFGFPKGSFGQELRIMRRTPSGMQTLETSLTGLVAGLTARSAAPCGSMSPTATSRW